MKIVSLFSGVFAKKMRNSLVLIERKTMGMSFEEEKRFNGVPMARKDRVEKPKRAHGWPCTIILQ